MDNNPLQNNIIEINQALNERKDIYELEQTLYIQSKFRIFTNLLPTNNLLLHGKLSMQQQKVDL